MENRARLVEMSEIDNGYSINNLSPFYIHTHIHEMLDKAKTGLTIYHDLQRISSIENTEIIIRIIRIAKSVEESIEKLIEQFSISECTAKYIVDSRLDELSMFGAFSYEEPIKIYEEAVRSLNRIYEMQVELDNKSEIEE